MHRLKGDNTDSTEVVLSEPKTKHSVRIVPVLSTLKCYVAYFKGNDEDFGKSVDGYDHNFIICPELCGYNEEYELPLIASVTNGKLILNVYTDQPGVHSLHSQGRWLAKQDERVSLTLPKA